MIINKDEDNNNTDIYIYNYIDNYNNYNFGLMESMSHGMLSRLMIKGPAFLVCLKHCSDFLRDGECLFILRLCLFLVTIVALVLLSFCSLFSGVGNNVPSFGIEKEHMLKRLSAYDGNSVEVLVFFFFSAHFFKLFVTLFPVFNDD